MKRLRILFIIVVGIFLYSIALSSFVRNLYLAPDTNAQWGIAGDAVKFMANLPSQVKQAFEAPGFYVGNSTAKDGLTLVSQVSDTVDYPNLLVSYKTKPFGQEFELLEVPSGASIRKWAPDNAELFERAFNEADPRKPPKGSDLHFMHALMLKDSSLIMNSQITSLLTRIGKDNSIMWISNDRNYHHTSELGPDGTVWVCSRPFQATQLPFLPDTEEARSAFMDDALTRIDPDTGEILFEKSVSQILIENGYGGLIVQKGQIISDPIHLNDIQPAYSTTEYWNRGDLLISCRNISTVFLYRPSEDKILWIQQGPWQNQHDADFVDGQSISIFGNDILREESTLDPKITTKNLFFPPSGGTNEIYLYNFENDSVTTPYSKLMEAEGINTITSGRSEILANGDIFVEDTNNGRIIIGDSARSKMEYVKRIDDEHISSLFWSRMIKN